MGKLSVRVFNLSYRTKTELEEALAIRLREREGQFGAGFCRAVQIMGACKDPDSPDMGACKDPDSPDRQIVSILASYWTDDAVGASHNTGKIRTKSFCISHMTLNELEMELNATRLRQWEEALDGQSCFSVQITTAAKDPEDPRRHIVSVLAAFR